VTYPCPYCLIPASPATGCPACGRAPDPDAAEVARTDAEIGELTAELTAARARVADVEARLGQAWTRRHAAAARVRAAVLATRTATDTRPASPAAPPAPANAPDGWTLLPPAPRAPRGREASTKLVQNVLFLLGGLLLAVAAIVFTAVAWAQFGVAGRAALLAFFTGAALAVPPLVLRRGLAATAETFAAVGLLLVLLDGYAAWYVDLFGVADGSPWAYAGAVCAVTAAVAAGYEHVTGLAGPRFAALLVAQPVPPLLVVPAHPDATGWSLTLAGVAALDLAVLAGRRFRFTGVTVAAYLCGGTFLLGAAVSALIGLALADTPVAAATAGTALLIAALLPVAGSILGRSPVAQAVAGALLVVALDVAAARFAVLLAPGFAGPVRPGTGTAGASPAAGATLLRVAVVTLAVAVLATLARRRLPRVPARGPLAGALLVIGAPALVALALTADAAVHTLDAARPFLGAVPDAAVSGAGWQLPVAVVVLAGALSTTLAAGFRREIALGAAALTALALPAALHLPWWSAPVLDLIVVAAALTAASAPGSRTPAHAAAAGSSAAASFTAQVLIAVLLGAHAVTVGFGAAAVAAGVLGAVALLGLATAALNRAGARRRELGGSGLLLGLLALPAAAWTTAAALPAPAVLQSRIVLAAAVLPVAAVAVLGRRRSDLRPFALAAALLTVVSAPLWAWAADDPPAVYAGAALVLLALTLPANNARPSARPGLPSEVYWTAVTAIPLSVALLAGTGPSLVRVLLLPYRWLDLIWTGRPAGSPHVPAADPVALLLLAAAAALAGLAVRDRRTAVWAAVPVLAVAVPLTLAAASAGWPAVPAAELLLGVAGLLVAALRPVPAPIPVVAGLLAAPGLAEALATRASTLAALGIVLVAAAATGIAARVPAARVAGWLTAVAAALAVAGTAGVALELDLRTTAFLVLAVAAAALALGTALLTRRAVEGRAVEAAAHAGAVLALLLTLGSPRYAAAVCTLWGLALGARALRPAARSGYVVAAAGAELAGWILLMAAAHVTTPEVYALPTAAVALLAGGLARRTRPALSSWTAYGPALAAALLPSLASVLAADGQYLRRLLLGLAALAVVVAGANARLRAPVIVGGAVLSLVALHEMGRVWDLIPRWIPLAAGGLLLVLLAMTLERRRRDLDRFRAAFARMR
jgi:hypothetical protein